MPQYENLLLEDWHHSHEDLVDIIESYGNASNVATLQKAFNLSLPYMSITTHYSFHRKLLYGHLKVSPLNNLPKLRKAVQGQTLSRIEKGIV